MFKRSKSLSCVRVRLFLVPPTCSLRHAQILLPREERTQVLLREAGAATTVADGAAPSLGRSVGGPKRRKTEVSLSLPPTPFPFHNLLSFFHSSSRAPPPLSLPPVPVHNPLPLLPLFITSSRTPPAPVPSPLALAAVPDIHSLSLSSFSLPRCFPPSPSAVLCLPPAPPPPGRALACAKVPSTFPPPPSLGPPACIRAP